VARLDAPVYAPEDWADTLPLPQDEPADALFAISYDPKYAEVFGYLRAALASGERSPRVLALTTAAVTLGPSHYTAWHVRRECLPDGDARALGAELDWLAALVAQKGAWKNYQVWHHRRLVAERLRDGARELAFSRLAIEEDEKNYHAWAHRQWALLFCEELAGGGGGADAAWAAEAALTAELLRADMHNNSAWNHRWFVLTRGGGAPRAVPAALRPAPAAIAGEVAFALAALPLDARNEAAWSYLRALVQLAAAAASDGGGGGGGGGGAAWAAWPEVLSFAAALCGGEGGAGAAAPNCFALEALAEAAEARGAAVEAAAAYERAAEGDPVREGYWRARARAAAP
jgi:protein farnesyltransferase/geranylgeranyltransferase type-1 subunit alpha